MLQHAAYYVYVGIWYIFPICSVQFEFGAEISCSWVGEEWNTAEKSEGRLC